MTRLVTLAGAVVLGLALAGPTAAGALPEAGPGHEDPVVRRGFDPQPEPPPARTAPGIGDPLRERGFDPQPEPPARIGAKISDPLREKGFNPQPEPPPSTGLAERGFNPQPEPPALGALGTPVR